MKQNISLIISALSVVLVLFCLARISSLQKQLATAQNNLSNRITTVENNVSNIYANVDAMLEEEASILSAGDFTLGEADVANGTVELTCTVTPKIYQPEGTTALLTCGGKEYSMTLENGAYSVTFPVSIFESTIVEKVSFSKDGTISTQSLNWYVSPREQYLPDLQAGFSGSVSKTAKNGIYSHFYNGQLSIDAWQRGDTTSTFETLHLLQYIDGEEAARSDILGQTKKEGTTYFGYTPAATITSSDPLSVNMSLNQTFEQPFGSTMELVVEGVDSYGYLYRSVIDRVTIDQQGNPVDDNYIGYGECSIYSPDGELLYGIEGNEATYLYK